jgi:putative DNA primase/helicase
MQKGHDMTHIGNEPRGNELVGNEAQSQRNLPAIDDAPPIAPLSQGEAQPCPGEGADGEPDCQDSEGHAPPGEGIEELAQLYRSFNEQQDGGEVRLHQDFDAGAPLRQGSEGQDFGERLRPIDITDLIALDIPPRGMVLDPIIPEKGLAMLYGARGVGKTRVAHGIGYAVATGSSFLRWQAPKPRRVLLIDGELPQADLRQRAIQAAGASERTAEHGWLPIISSDRVDRGVGNLGSPVVQAEVERWLDGVELLILDNLSSLTVGVRENDGDAWAQIQDWLLRLRRRGISVLIIHHAGKHGGQRGTSRREDVLDTSLSLRQPSDYTIDQGARFEVHIEKGRGLAGDHARPFEAQLELADGKAAWIVKDAEEAVRIRVAALLAAGMSVREIAEEVGATRSAVHRLKQRLEREAREANAGAEGGAGDGG